MKTFHIIVLLNEWITDIKNLASKITHLQKTAD